MKVTWVGMRDNHRLIGVLDRFECGALGTVRHVDNHTNAVHLFNDLFAKPCQTTVLIFIATAGQQALVVVGQLHDH